MALGADGRLVLLAGEGEIASPLRGGALMPPRKSSSYAQRFSPGSGSRMRGECRMLLGNGGQFYGRILQARMRCTTLAA